VLAGLKGRKTALTWAPKRKKWNQQNTSSTRARRAPCDTVQHESISVLSHSRSLAHTTPLRASTLHCSLATASSSTWATRSYRK